MVLGRVKPALEASQPEEQHGLRRGRRLEKHLVSANLVIDKLLAVGKPVWIVSLDLSKAFDRVNWSKLWTALAAHGVSQHLVWIIQCLYWKQEGCVKGEVDLSTRFRINSGVRQGCVLSPTLFSSVQQWAMRKWRIVVEHAPCGIDLQDALPKLLDQRFADDILLFARTAHETIFLLESLMQEFAEVGLLLNGEKTVVLTNEANPNRPPNPVGKHSVPRRPPSIMALAPLLRQPTLQLPAPHAATKHHQAVCPRTRPCRSNLSHHPPGHTKCASYHSSSRALTPPPRRSWPHLRHRHSSPGILSFVGGHHAHTAPPGAPTSNSSSPATPSRSPRNPIHPGSHPSPRTTPTPRLRIPLLGRPCSGLHTTNTTRPRTTTPRARMATPGSISITPGLPHRTDGQPWPPQPGHAPVPVRSIRQPCFLHHAFWTRYQLSFPSLPCPAPQTPSSPIASVSTCLSAPSHSRPTRRPSRSMRPGRGFTGERGPFGTSCSSNLSGSRSPGYKQHPA